ncbi:ARM repeat-containing protein, partial [Rhodotorula sp. JG-1b]
MGGAFSSGGRNKSERGSKRRGGPPGERDESRKPGGHVTGEGFEGATLEPRSETGWAPTVIAGATVTDPNSVEMVQRKVKALLNKLTLEKFDSISKQILEWANKSVQETDGRILRQVIALIFEKATDEATWSEMYARLCRFLMESVSTEVRDESVKAADGTPVTGGALFRKYLLNRCQEDYEQGKEADDKAKKDANDAAKKEAEDTGKEPAGEAELLSEEYYAAQKAKRRGLGLVRFIGELYRLSMLTERIMHECIKKLLANTENPEEEDIESLCRLLTTVGKGLDNAKAKQHMDVYFSRMRTIADNPKVTSRMRFMIMDVVDLRASRWQSKQESAGPKTISQIHAEAQKQ